MGWLNDTNSGSYSPFTPGVSVGLRNVGSYQVSGPPFITGSANMGTANSIAVVSFPYVAKEVTVFTSGSNSQLQVGFRNEGATGGNVFGTGRHYISLSNADSTTPTSHTFDVKCTAVYVKNINANAAFEVYASLTNIPTQRMYQLTGSGITDDPT